MKKQPYDKQENRQLSSERHSATNILAIYIDLHNLYFK